jgi:DNA-binding NarL/FixJ family response regulator
VVLTDMMMLGMDGLATIRALWAICPAVPAVLISGLHAQSMIDTAAELGVRHVVSKTFTITTLLHTLRDSLEEPGSSC